jgi:hypothetical protein
MPGGDNPYSAKRDGNCFVLCEPPSMVRRYSLRLCGFCGLFRNGPATYIKPPNA